MDFPKNIEFLPSFWPIFWNFLQFLIKTPCMHRLQTLLFSKKEYFLMWNIAFLPIWFPSILPSNTLGIKTLTFGKSALILDINLVMGKPPFKRNPYLRDKFGLTDFSLKSRFYCILNHKKCPKKPVPVHPTFKR